MIPEGLTFDDVLLEPGYNDIPSRSDVDISAAFGGKLLEVPVISANMDTITDWKMARAMNKLGGFGILHRFMSVAENVRMVEKLLRPKPDGLGEESEAIRAIDFGVSIGVGTGGQQRAAALYEVGARIFCIDVAHGHSKAVGQQIKNLRSNYGNSIFIIAGNVATYAGADYLASCGADAIKVGIGPGSVCTTRIKTGCGVPQLTAIKNCSRVGRIIIADGGIRTPGDAAKALAAGANVVMVGGMLAGTNETPGEMQYDFGGGYGPKQNWENPHKVYRGMASKEAQDDAHGGMPEWKTAEGVTTRIPAKGPAADVMSDIAGGIRSCLTYVGARSIQELQAKAQFQRITHAGRVEGTPHGQV